MKRQTYLDHLAFVLGVGRSLIRVSDDIFEKSVRKETLRLGYRTMNETVDFVKRRLRGSNHTPSNGPGGQRSLGLDESPNARMKDASERRNP